MARKAPHGFAAVLLLSVQVLFAADPKPTPETFSGEVAGAVDGDTLNLMVGGLLRKIRLYGIDAPERKQPFWEEAKKALAKRFVGKEVQVLVMGKDGDGLTLGVIRLDGRCINTSLVREGYAWHDTRTNKSPTLIKAEKQARSKKLGLWARADPMPPWEWRRIEEAKQAAKQPNDTPEGATAAGSDSAYEKTYWLNLSSNVRHNNTCKHYKHTSRGRPCTSSEGRACKTCGG